MDTFAQIISALTRFAAEFEHRGEPDTSDRESFVAGCCEILNKVLPNAPLSEIDREASIAEQRARRALASIMAAIEECADPEEKPLSEAGQIFADRWEDALSLAKDIRWITAPGHLREHDRRRRGLSDKLRGMRLEGPVSGLADEAASALIELQETLQRQESAHSEARSSGVQRAMLIINR